MEKKHGALVSIGLPVYNGENYLSQALDSLLNQTYPDFEIIISDNASTDATQNICLEYQAKDNRIFYHRYEVNRGAAWNFNNTFHLSKGIYFKWAAHDDLHHPDFIKKCVEVLNSQTDVVLCFTRTNFIDGQGDHIKEYPYPINISESSQRHRFLHFAATGHIVHEIFGLIRVEALKGSRLIGSYLGSDLILLGELSLKGKFIQVPEVLFEHRDHNRRSMLNPDGAQNFTQWYDSSKSGKYVMPHLRRLFESFITVSRHPWNFKAKILSYYDLFRVANWKKREFFFEFRKVFNDLFSAK